MNGYLTSALVGALFLLGGALIGATMLLIDAAEAAVVKQIEPKHEVSRPAVERQLPGVLLVTAIKG